MFDALSRVPGLTIFPSQGNFILVKAPNMWDGVELRDYLVANHGVCVRECGNKLGMTSQYLRLVVRPPDDVDRLVEGLYAYGRHMRGGSESQYQSESQYPAESRYQVESRYPSESRYSSETQYVDDAQDLGGRAIASGGRASVHLNVASGY